MFKRDIDQFRFENREHRFMGQGPPEGDGPPHHPPFGNIPPFGLFTPFSSGPFRPPTPIGKEAFQEIRDFIVLMIITEYPNGITGSQLQEKYNFPRGTMIRNLQELEDKKYLMSKEEIVETRPNKFFLITELGRKYLEELKLKWGNVFSMMSEITPSKGLRMILSEKIENFEDKDDAIDFFRGIRSWMRDMLQRIENRIENFKKRRADLDRIIKEIEKMESLDKEKIMEMVEDSIKMSEKYE
ncbi:MAG: hypothetical protein ACFE9C_02360 [Candidatus Hodarchaeota archaeon]